MPLATIESLDYECKGIAHIEGKTIFVEGALLGEKVEFSAYRKKPAFEQATVTRILKESTYRTVPRCPHFGVCGGCSMQHLEASAQTAVKQRVLEDTLWHLGRVRPEVVFPAIYGPTWGYRYRARLSVKNVIKKGSVLVGFHERKSSYVADMQTCEILPRHISDLLLPLRGLVAGLSIVDRLPQIELAIGDDVIALVLRILEPLSPADESLLRAFADEHRIQFWLQSKGPDTVTLFHPLDGPELAYSLPEFGIRMPFRPTDFTQVNHAINRVLVKKALALLAPQPGERIADMFCGLGNFTLPIAKSGAFVLGMEGSEALVRRARENAVANGLSDNTEFLAANLFEMDAAQLAALGQFDRMLIDPPREGAIALVKALPEPDSGQGPRRIVYVACNPATLARDAGVLTHEKGYVLKGAGIANMFPHTSHVESIALFEKE
jgi:23S rRNA (uracil1939-C5)-methyltransferase